MDSVGLDWLNHQQKQVHGGGTGGGAGGCDFDRRFFCNGNNGPFQVWPAVDSKKNISVENVVM